MILAAIVICEVLFWALLFGGLLVRYTLGWKRVSTVMLWMTPVVDFGLLAFTFIDLQSGQVSTFVHGFAAFYIGFSIIFGPITVRALDVKFARRFAIETHSEKASPERQSPSMWWWRVILASLITLGLLIILVAAAGLENSFWLTYWGVVAFTLPLSALILSRVLQRRRKAKEIASDD